LGYFEKRHAETRARRVKALEPSREKHILEDGTLLLKVIGRLLKDPAISKENVYNIDETGGHAIYARYSKSLSR
jgi:hypothetical protein